MKREKLITDLTQLIKSSGINIQTINSDFKELMQAIREKVNDWEGILSSQLKTLEQNDCPKEYINALWEKRGYIFTEASKAMDYHSWKENIVPFLPVIPTNYLSVPSLFKMLRNGKSITETGCSISLIRRMECNDLKKEEGVESEPYFIFGVSDGSEKMGVSQTWQDGSGLNKYQRYLFIEEVISLCLHTPVLQRHNIISIYTTWKGNGCGLQICFDEKGKRVFLSAGPYPVKRPYGAPSCVKNGY